MSPKINISFKILPFNNFNFEFKNPGEIKEEGKKTLEPPIYREPVITNIEEINISFEESDNYITPKTTSGI